MKDTFGEDLAPYEVVGEPADLLSAEALALANRHQFEWWALGQVAARPAQDKKKGADSGIDGVIHFNDDNSGKYKRVLIQVKSGHVKAGDIRDLKGVLEREQAPIGALLTLKPPTRPMREEAAAAGFYEPEFFPGHRFPRLQILTIAELFAGKELQYPRFAPAGHLQKSRPPAQARPAAGAAVCVSLPSPLQGRGICRRSSSHSRAFCPGRHSFTQERFPKLVERETRIPR